MQLAGIILCGGRSKRMGRDKASLPLGEGQTLLGCTLGQLRTAIGDGPLVGVAAAEQLLPELPPEVLIVRDRHPDRGPLEALATGLQTLDGNVEIAVVVGCDTPLVSPALLSRLASQLDRSPPETQAAMPVVEGQRQPLLAAYRTEVLAQVQTLLTAGKRSLHSLLDTIQIAKLTSAELHAIDPQCHSLLNCNDPESYERVRTIVNLHP